MSDPLCWRGCGRTAPPGMLSCHVCRATAQAQHDVVQSERQDAYAREVNEANLAARGSRYVPCRGCGAPGAVLARWARSQEIESERRTTERRLRMTHEDSDSFQRSIALTSPAGNFDPDDLCSACARAKYSTFFD